MEGFGSKFKIILIVLVFVLIIGGLIAGLAYLLFSPKGSSTNSNLYTENQLSITKYPITTPIVW